MRFRTIWSIPAMTIAERLRRTRDWAAMTIGANLPLRIRFWTTMQEIGYATSRSENVPATSLNEILENLRKPANLS